MKTSMQKVCRNMHFENYVAVPSYNGIFPTFATVLLRKQFLPVDFKLTIQMTFSPEFLTENWKQQHQKVLNSHIYIFYTVYVLGFE